MSYQILPCFSALDFEHDSLNTKAELRKNNKNLAMIMNYKGELGTLSQPFLKTSLQHIFE